MEAIRVYTRYDLPDEKGETRRERNKKVDFETPDFEIPPAGEYLWEWFTKLSNAIYRVDFNGYYYCLPPSEILAWCKFTRIDLTENEFEIISAMDNAFCKELNAEIEAKRLRKMDKQKEETNSKVRKGGNYGRRSS